MERYYSVGASLTTWTYKGNGSETQWFLRYTKISNDANIVKNSYNTILKKRGTKLQTQKHGINKTIESALADKNK